MSISRPIYNIEVNQNATFKLSLELRDSASVLIPINSWSFSGSIKQNYADVDPPLMFFTASADVGTSTIEFSLTPNQTQLLDQPNYYYDFTGTNWSTVPDEIYRILEGKVKVYPGVTDPNPLQRD
jgi:hypothetical protein